MDIVNIDGFKTASREHWRAIVEKELRGAAYEESLVGKFLNDLELDAYHDEASLKELPYLVEEVQSAVKFMAAEKSGKAYEINASKPKAANQIALAVLAQGIDSLIFDLRSAQQFEESILSGIDCSILSLGFGLKFSKFQNLGQDLPWKILTGSRVYLEINAGEVSSIQDLISIFSELKSLAKGQDVELKLCIDFGNLAEFGANFSSQLAAVSIFYEDFLSQCKRDELAEALVIGHAASPLFLPEIAKSRALSCLCASALKQHVSKLDEFHPSGQKITFNPAFLGTTDPENNLIRLSSYTMAAYACNPELISLSQYKQDDKLSTHRVTANLCSIAEFESSLHHYVDPSAGSFYVESLTQALIQKALERKTNWGLSSWAEFLNNPMLSEALETEQDRLQQQFKNKEVEMIGENLFPPQNKSELEKIALRNSWK